MHCALSALTQLGTVHCVRLHTQVKCTQFPERREAEHREAAVRRGHWHNWRPLLPQGAVQEPDWNDGAIVVDVLQGQQAHYRKPSPCCRLADLSELRQGC